MKHKHNWHFVKIDYNCHWVINLDKSYATFICDCGQMKEVEVKEVKNGSDNT